ncbi:MAG: sigma-70 family RNA polymerase sigma factor [Bacteroidota bacterium]
MSENKMIDHLFRHQYGKMVSILTRIFGLQHLEMIEDAVQDTFIRALKAWRTQIPDNPEAWLTQSAKNRILDLLRKLNADQKRELKLQRGPASIAINELFLDHEIGDSQLRMIFTACNPVLNPKDQIAFSLKTISGFSSKEIATSLLLKEETVKKRLIRARKAIKEAHLAFVIPMGEELSRRLDRVLEVIYLIFNEGFHSIKKDILIREDLCEEALRLCKLVLKNPHTAKPKAQALFALLCFHAARLKSKIDENKEIISLRDQDRTLWKGPLIIAGHLAMTQAVETDEFSVYHYEAAIASEHLKAKSYEDTDWDRILLWYERLQKIAPSVFTELNIAVIHIQRGALVEAEKYLALLEAKDLEQRAYLYYATQAELSKYKGERENAIQYLEKAISLCPNQAENRYLTAKQKELLSARA